MDFEAGIEGLDVMEPGLLQGPEAVEYEVIEAFFRVACSSKSIAWAFGCVDVPGSSPGMENPPEEMRDGRRPVTAEATDVLRKPIAGLQISRKQVPLSKKLAATPIA
jgi:two-component system chemotaxis sensor kinase CheA